MLFRHWDAWRRRRAEAYLAMSIEQRYRHHQFRKLAAIVTIPGVILGTASIAAAYGTGLFDKGAPAAMCTPTVVPAPARASFELHVLNATGEGGRATTVGRDMTKRHFKVVEMSNAPESLYIKGAGVVYHGSAGTDQALLVQAQMPGSRLFDDGRKGTSVSLVIGSGFTGLVPLPPRDEPRPGDVTVNVYNTTYRDGLAKQVQDALVMRGFKKGKIGNDPQGTFLPKDVALIRFGPDGDLTAKRVHEQVPLAKLVQDDRTGTSVDLVLGNKYESLQPLDLVPTLPPLVTRPPETVARPCSTSG